MIKIVQILGSYMPAAKFGGANRVMYSYANILRKNYQVDVITTDVKDETGSLDSSEKLPLIKNFKVNYYKVHSAKLASNYNITLSFGFWASILRNIKNYTHCHLAEFRGLTVFFVQIALFFNRDVKLIHSGFGMLGKLNKKGPIKTAFVFLYDLIFTSFLIKRIDLVLVESELEILEYRRFGYKGSYKVLPHFVEGKKNKESIKLTREDFNLSTNTYNLVSVTRIHHSKGIINSIRLVRELNLYSNKRKYKLTVCGNDEGALKELTDYVSKYNLHEQINFIPPCYTDELFLLYYKADAFILLHDKNLKKSRASIEALSENCFIINNENSYIEGLKESGAGFSIFSKDDIDYSDLIFAIDNKGNKPVEFYKKNMSSEVVKNILIDSVFCE